MNKSEENKNLVLKLYEGFASRDRAALELICDPQITWIQMPGFPGGVTSTGVEAIIKNVYEGNSGRWASFNFSKESINAFEDLVIVQGKYHVVAHQTGLSASAITAHIFTIENTKVTKFQQFTDSKLLADCYAKGKKEYKND